jgi:SAM-dependent methyltransferase
MNLVERRPPSSLGSRIGGLEAAYEEIGLTHARAIGDLLPMDWTWSGRRILDFGCGTGRTLVHFAAEAAEAEFWGCDIDEPSIEWAHANLSPPFRFLHNEELPPVDLPAGQFDLVYAMSVFTHLSDTWSAWLLEMRRLLKLGGLALFSFLGEGMIRALTRRGWDEDQVGMIALDRGRPWSIGGPNVLHSEWWLRKHWGRAFEVVTVRPYWYGPEPSGHGLILMRKDDRPAPTVEELERLDVDDPREIASLQLNIDLLQQRLAELWESHVPEGAAEPHPERARLEAELRAIRSSTSWRLTTPVRSLGRRLKGP